MAERALITGGAGFVGVHLARRLLAEGTEVTLVDDLSRGRRDDTLLELQKSARFIQHDLTQPIPADLFPTRVDVVYHLAAMVGVQRTTDMPGRLLHTNIAATANLLDWCDRTEPATIYLSSTSEVSDGAAALGAAPFPTPEKAPFALVEPHASRSSYALSKLVSENMLLYRSERHRIRIGRYFNVYGPRMGRSHVMPQFVGRVLAGEDPFRIYGAYQTRAFCFVDDAVSATIGLTRSPGAEPVVANIGDDTREIRMLDLAQMVFDLAGVRPDVEILDPPPNSPQRRLADLSTLRRLQPGLRYTPLETGLRQLFDWYRSEPR